MEVVDWENASEINEKFNVEWFKIEMECSSETVLRINIIRMQLKRRRLEERIN